MRGVDARAHSLPPGAATNFSDSRGTRSQKPFTSESPAHPWRALVRQTLKSYRNGQRLSHYCRLP
jgi:hypothetical protein